MRVNIPGNAGQQIKLAKAILAKHIALGAASPLNGIEGIAGFGAQVALADSNNLQADLFYKQAETAIEARDKALGPTSDTPGSVRFMVTSAREVLSGLNKGTRHKLTEWGFVVNAPATMSPAAKAAAKAVRAAIKAAKK